MSVIIGTEVGVGVIKGVFFEVFLCTKDVVSVGTMFRKIDRVSIGYDVRFSVSIVVSVDFNVGFSFYFDVRFDGIVDLCLSYDVIAGACDDIRFGISFSVGLGVSPKSNNLISICTSTNTSCLLFFLRGILNIG